MTPAQVQYLIDTLLGILIAGAIAAGELWTTTGTVDGRVLAVAFVGGALAFGRKFLSVQYGADSVAVPKAPAAYPVTPTPDVPPQIPPS